MLFAVQLHGVDEDTFIVLILLDIEVTVQLEKDNVIVHTLDHCQLDTPHLQ